MFNFLKKRTVGKQIVFKVEGMHCVSCGMSIDGDLEDTDGIICAETNYAKARTTIIYDPAKVTSKKLKEIIESQNYFATEIAQKK